MKLPRQERSARAYRTEGRDELMESQAARAYIAARRRTFVAILRITLSALLRHTLALYCDILWRFIATYSGALLRHTLALYCDIL